MSARLFWIFVVGTMLFEAGAMLKECDMERRITALEGAALDAARREP